MTEIQRSILEKADQKLQEAHQILYSEFHIAGVPCGDVLDRIAAASLGLDKMKAAHDSRKA